METELDAQYGYTFFQKKSQVMKVNRKLSTLTAAFRLVFQYSPN